ncbi:MAG: molybdopterin-guanine dinucleotide biosynthesis protein B [Anaerolineaceae bacterium]|jgi:molybdopterin-guanine dinucleotide biosynthesis protein MobB|nr:molybdopterin-guanine dinucleotide biosynthesis protein B [Anaerolineaceae bacterium]
MTIPILSIVGKSGSGKTTLIEKLIPALKQQGFRIATIKHHFHADFDIDIPGKDSWRHAQAGSEHVILVSSSKIAAVRQLSRELTIDEIAAEIKDVDLIIAEGYKTPQKPKIEIVRAARSQSPVSDPAELIAIASDLTFDLPVAQFDLNDVEGIAALVIEQLLS